MNVDVVCVLFCPCFVSLCCSCVLRVVCVLCGVMCVCSEVVCKSKKHQKIFEQVSSWSHGNKFCPRDVDYH